MPLSSTRPGSAGLAVGVVNQQQDPRGVNRHDGGHLGLDLRRPLERVAVNDQVREARTDNRGLAIGALNRLELAVHLALDLSQRDGDGRDVGDER